MAECGWSVRHRPITGQARSHGSGNGRKQGKNWWRTLQLGGDVLAERVDTSANVGAIKPKSTGSKQPQSRHAPALRYKAGHRALSPLSRYKCPFAVGCVQLA